MSDRETIIKETVNSDGYHYYIEVAVKGLRDAGLPAESVPPDEEAEVRERWEREADDPDDDVWLRVFPDRDEPLGDPYTVERNEETGGYETVPVE